MAIQQIRTNQEGSVLTRDDMDADGAGLGTAGTFAHNG
jgi:hypothetical protein